MPELSEAKKEESETRITEELANELSNTFGMSYERRADVRYLFTFNEKNDKGESIAVELSLCEDFGGKNSLPKEWHRLGYTSEVLSDYWGITVYVTDKDGNCWGRYNPTSKHNGKRPVIDFEYMMRATRANAFKLFKEIKRRAFGEFIEESNKEDAERPAPSMSVKAYEKKVTGERFTVKQVRGDWYTVDRLDNSMSYCRTKEEAYSNAASYNSHTDKEGRLKRAV